MVPLTESVGESLSEMEVINSDKALFSTECELVAPMAGMFYHYFYCYCYCY